MLGARKVEYDLLTMSFRSSGGISAGDMYREKILNASSEKESWGQSEDHSLVVGISSGMKRPPSLASPLRTTSSKES
jgi:hypothetical protein